jgi:hypothetical protein
MEPHLHHAATVAGDADHRAAFIDRVGGWFFDVDMRTSLERGDGLQRVPVVGRGNNGDFRFLLFEQLAVIFVNFGLIPAEIVHLVGGDFERVSINVAEGDDPDAIAFHRLLKYGLAPPTGADEGGAVFVVRVRAEQGQGREGHSCGGGRLKETAAVHDLVLPKLA